MERLLTPWALVIAVAVLIAPPRPARADGPAAEEAVVVYRQLRPAVVGIENAEGTGTGILLRDDGLVLTNAHVVTSPLPYRVKVDAAPAGGGGAGGGPAGGGGGKPAAVVYTKVAVVGYHPRLDLALVRIDPKEHPDNPLRPAALGKAKGEPGQRIYVIGNPAAGGTVLTKSITTGILSAVDREVDGEGYYQIDAAVNPGSSGGPVVDAAGGVLGLVTFKFADADAVAFAVPLTDGVDEKAFVPLAKRRTDAARSKALQDLGERYAKLAEAVARREGPDSPNRYRLNFYAATCYRLAVIDAPDNPGVWYSIGMLLRTIDVDDVAAGYLVRSIQVRPWDAERGNPYRELGFALVKSKQDEKALIAWREGLAKHPFAAKVWEDLAIYHIQHEQFADAAHAASTALLIGGDTRANVMTALRADALNKIRDADEAGRARRRCEPGRLAAELDGMLSAANAGRKGRELYLTRPFGDLVKEMGGDDLDGVKDAITTDPEPWPAHLKRIAPPPDGAEPGAGGRKGTTEGSNG